MGTKTQLAAGWYGDPADAMQYRYWTGKQWTTDVVARDEVDVPAETRPLPTFGEPIEAEPPTPQVRHSRRLPLLGLGALLVAGAAYFLWPSGPAGHTITGEVRIASVDAQALRSRLPDTEEAGDGTACTTGPAGSDIHAGTEVTVTSGRGEVLGTGRLERGVLDRTPNSTSCVFGYTVSGVTDAAVYTVQVADRRPLRFARDEVEAAGWRIDLRIN